MNAAALICNVIATSVWISIGFDRDYIDRFTANVVLLAFIFADGIFLFECCAPKYERDYSFQELWTTNRGQYYRQSMVLASAVTTWLF
jgi:hypothetical protein